MKAGSFARLADIMSRTQRDSLNVNMPQGDSRGEASIQKCGFELYHSPRAGAKIFARRIGGEFGGFLKPQRLNASSQTGRSMVEMLAVLAIVGVLSIVLMLGYTIAMNKYRANEIIAGVKLRAYAVSWQPQNEPGTEQDLTEFAEKILTYKTTAWAGGLNGEEDLFTIDVDDVQQGVCQEILNRNWTLPAGIFVFDQKVSTCPEGNAQMSFVFPVDLEDDVDVDEQNLCYGKGPCCEVISEEDRTIRVGKRLARRTCQTSTNGLVCCTSGPLVCMYDDDEITKYEPFQDTEITCTGDFVCDGLICKCAQSCGAGQTQDSTTCACSCTDPTQEMWNGKCVPKCDGDGMTGERDENGQCICEAGLDADTCQCPEGTIFVEGTCQEFHCIEIASETKTYTCYLNGKWCASLCTSATPKNAGDCSGYCNPKFCDGKGTWLQESIPGSGFGCLASNGLYCATYQKSSMKMCTPKTSAIQPKDLCCEAHGDFGVCTRGTCDASACDAFGGTYTYVADRRWGCEITRNNYTAYCIPFDGSWNCQYTPAPDLAISGNPNFCGRCSASELAAGNCGNCFTGVKNCPWGEYDADLDRCVGTLNGIKMSCDFSGNCYYGASKDSNRCAYLCDKVAPGNYPVCHYGMCDETACPAGSEFVYMAGTYLNIYGCQTKRDGYTLFYKDGDAGNNNACFIGQALCGGLCTKDCSSCEVYNHEACASGRCLKYGSLIDKNNDGVADCTCEGSATNGHCCEKGHVYLNGGCTQLSCPAGQCVTDGGLCKELSAEICRDDSGLCQKVSNTLTRDDSGNCVINQG